MSLEKELSLSKGSIKALELSQVDHEKLQRTHASLLQDVMSMKSQLLESTSVMKEAARQKDRYKNEYECMKEQLVQERKELSDFKTMSERNLSRLRMCIQEERCSYEERIRKLEEESRILTKERDEYVNRYRSSSGILHQIRIRMTAVEKNIISSSSTSPEKKKQTLPLHRETTTAPASSQNHHHCHRNHHNHNQAVGTGYKEQLSDQVDEKKSSSHIMPVISPECHQKLKKQYKDLKRKQSELTHLLNSMQQFTTAHPA